MPKTVNRWLIEIVLVLPIARVAPMGSVPAAGVSTCQEVEHTTKYKNRRGAIPGLKSEELTARLIWLKGN